MTPGPFTDLPVSDLDALEARLTFLQRWLEPGTTTFPALIQDWLQSNSWSAAQLLWPARAVVPQSWTFVNSRPVSHASDSECLPSSEPAADSLFLLPLTLDQRRQILAAYPHVVELSSAGSGCTPMLGCALGLPGSPRGLLVVAGGATRPWSRWDRDFLQFSARLIERSPALDGYIPRATDVKRLDERLTDANVFCSRLAHDFDNILTGVIGFAELTAPLLAEGSLEAEYVSEIRRAGERGKMLTQQLRRLKPAVSPCLSSLRFGPWFRELLDAVVAGRPQRFQISSNNFQRWPPVQASQESLERLFRELLTNAIEAMPQGGSIRLTGELREVRDTSQFLGQPAPGQYLEICIDDEGIGVKPEFLPRLFRELFLTSKPQHRGLGLAIALRVILDLRGGICLTPRPAPESGTRITVLLPTPLVETAGGLSFASQKAF